MKTIKHKYGIKTRRKHRNKTKRKRRTLTKNNDLKDKKVFKDYGDGIIYMIFDGNKHVFKYVGK